MSIKAISWAFHVQSPMLSGTDASVLVGLADNADDRGLAWPSIETIARKTKFDRKTVQSALQRLEKHGFIHDTGQRVGITRSVKVFRLQWADERAEANPKTGQLSEPENGTANGRSDPNSYPKNGVGKLSQKRDTEPSFSLTKEPKRQQLSEFLEILKADLQYDGIDIEEEYSKAQRWYLEKKLRLTRRGFYKWLDKELQDTEGELEEDEELATETPYYSWEGWTDQRRRALLELWPGSTLPPERWDKVSPSVKELIEGRVKEGWSA